MSTYNEQMQGIANRYLEKTGAQRVTARTIAAWAISTGLLETTARRTDKAVH